MQNNAKQCKTMQNNAKQCKTMQNNAKQCKTMQNNAKIQYNHGYSTTLYSECLLTK
jgi:hypothetical protein